MNFFESQRQAKKNTYLLLFIFSINVLAISCLNSALVYFFFPYKLKFAIIAFSLSVLILAGAALYFVNSMSNGITVATSLGGRQLNGQTNSTEEKMLLNISEEIAIASGISPPLVFILDHEPTINAFATGSDIHHSVIALTKGALTQLDRDELQAVIGHEYSHILNDDLHLNTMLAGFVKGFQIFTKVGNNIMKMRSRDKGGLVVIGGGLTLFGWFGYLLSRILQSFISKEREFLADASSAQFTRNPRALASALAKINTGGGSVLISGNKFELAHIFFADAVLDRKSNWFATHPSILERIQKLLPNESIDEILTASFYAQKSLSAEAVDKVENIFNLNSFTQQLQSTNSILNQFAEWPQLLKNPQTAKLALAIVIFHSQPNFAEFLSLLQAESPNDHDFETLKKTISNDEKARTVIFQIALASLRELSLREKENLLDSMMKTFLQDQKISLLEGLLFINTEFILLPAKQRQSEKIQFDQILANLKNEILNQQSVDLTVLKNQIANLNALPLSKRKEFLEKLSNNYELNQSEEFRLLAMSIKIAIPRN